jgi:hypothetical protein
MLPSHIFFTLVDSSIAFQIDIPMRNTSIKVARAKAGKLRMTINDSSFDGDATSILRQLNYAILAEDFGGNFGSTPFFDTGAVVRFTITPERATGELRGHVAVEATILARTPILDEGTRLVVQVEIDRKHSIHLVAVNGQVIAELAQVSRLAMPDFVHKMIVADGMDWAGSPSAEESYVALYGEAARDSAIAEAADAQAGFENAMLAALKKG